MRHKSHVPKAMFLACTADNRDGGTGKIGIWRVAETVEAQRAAPSKGRERGDEYDKDVKMDSEQYFKMMIVVLDALAAAFPDAAEIIVQQDVVHALTRRRRQMASNL